MKTPPIKAPALGSWERIVNEARKLGTAGQVIYAHSFVIRHGAKAKVALCWLCKRGELRRIQGGKSNIPSVYRGTGLTPAEVHTAKFAPLPNGFRPARAYGAAGVPEDLVNAMWAAFQRLGSLHKAGREFGRTGAALSSLFQSRGLRDRPPMPGKPRVRNELNQFVAAPPIPQAEIEAMIAEARRVMIPPRLKSEWRHWPQERRAWFIRELWKRIDSLHSAKAMPRGPFSANLQPFDYGSAEAHDLARSLNGSLDSRHVPVKLKLGSRGVIWQGRLYYWAVEAYYSWGSYKPGIGRPALHRLIWESSHGPLPEGHVVYHLDGNKNNLVPANLGLKTKNDVARENQAGWLQRKSRQATEALLNRHTRKESDEQAGSLHQLQRQVLTAGRRGGG